MQKGILADCMYDSNNNFRYLSKNHIKHYIKTRSNSKVRSRTNCHARNMSVARQQTSKSHFAVDSSTLLPTIQLVAASQCLPFDVTAVL
jgi:hypothetical protein